MTGKMVPHCGGLEKLGERTGDDAQTPWASLTVSAGVLLEALIIIPRS
jgi:hypothetical protein